MVREGDQAPDFTVPLAGGEAYNDLEAFTLSDAIGDGPIVLAFYPAAFTSGCTDEMCAFRDSMPGFDDLDAHVYGVSVDLPFSQNIWIQQHDLNFPMLSDWDHDIIHKYDVVYDGMYDMIEAAQRSLFIIDETGTISYAWVRDGDNPDFGHFVSDIQERVAELSHA